MCWCLYRDGAGLFLGCFPGCEDAGACPGMVLGSSGDFFHLGLMLVLLLGWGWALLGVLPRDAGTCPRMWLGSLSSFSVGKKLVLALGWGWGDTTAAHAGTGTGAPISTEFQALSGAAAGAGGSGAHPPPPHPWPGGAGEGGHSGGGHPHVPISPQPHLPDRAAEGAGAPPSPHQHLGSLHGPFHGMRLWAACSG